MKKTLAIYWINRKNNVTHNANMKILLMLISNSPSWFHPIQLNTKNTMNIHMIMTMIKMMMKKMRKSLSSKMTVMMSSNEHQAIEFEKIINNKTNLIQNNY